MSSSAFIPFWLCDRPRNTFLSYVPKDDLISLRLACYDFGVRTAPYLFREIAVTFREKIFTKPVRMAALGRIGQHVQTLKFAIPHSEKTFLPPLVDTGGVEVAFIYEPYIGSPKDPVTRHSIPTYGSWEMNDLLVKQYPPLFHDAAKVSAFIQAFSAMSNMRHLEVSCPGQPSEERRRRSVVDYALISLRIAVERSKLSRLETLSLSPIHPGAVQYLNPSLGFGVNPRSTKCWRQIRQLTIQMDTIDSGSPVDHLKFLHSYLQNFAPFLTGFNFRWQGSSENKGPCPVSLPTENCIQAAIGSHECHERCDLPLPCLRFERLRDIEIMNIFPDSPQIKRFIRKHRRTLESLKLNNVEFRLGDWDDALSPLTEISGSEKWKETAEEVMDVPLMLSPLDFEQERHIRAWNHRVRTRTSSSKPLQGALHRASAKGKELLFGTEEHMRRLLSGSILSWL
ncbi:MAG: hypothetical protein ASARMPRED_006214 [Alectoria sarmentosa]|nr:MAG: hypothetical protein ASARMPRED_006214 [Alectoria sarmentosa]